MSTKLMISALRRGKNGKQILSILDNLIGDVSQSVDSSTAQLPDPGYIITWDGRQVVF